MGSFAQIFIEPFSFLSPFLPSVFAYLIDFSGLSEIRIVSTEWKDVSLLNNVECDVTSGNARMFVLIRLLFFALGAPFSVCARCNEKSFFD